jgi:hypothetical protein
MIEMPICCRSGSLSEAIRISRPRRFREVEFSFNAGQKPFHRRSRTPSEVRQRRASRSRQSSRERRSNAERAGARSYGAWVMRRRL